MLEDLSAKLEAILRKVKGQGKLTEENISDSLKEIRRALNGAIPALEEAAEDDNRQVAGEAEQVLRRIKRTLDIKLQEPTVEDQKE